MICISDILGNITTVLPESLHQGSRGVNKIVLLAPFPSSATVSVFLTLPNGMSLYPVLAEGADPNAYKMAAVDVALGVQKDGVDLNAWAYTIKAPVTEYSGTLTVQFSITMTDGQLTTSAVNLPISRGVPTLSPTVTEKDLNTIAAYLTAAQTAATAAEQSAEDAADAATSAATSAGNAATSETNAANSESRALGYATRAETAAANAEQDEALLDQAVTDARTAAGAASASALEARQYERGALTAKDGAAEEAAKAVDAAEEAATSEANAAASEASASSAATRAVTAADKTEEIYNEISPFKERLENLESFKLYSTDSISGATRKMTVPARSAKYAIIDRLSCTVKTVKSYGANLLNGGISNPPVSNGVTFEKRTDGGYDIKRTEPSAGTASSYVLNKAEMIGDGDYITISIYGSTIGTRLRAYTYNADGTQAEVITLDDNTRSATLRRLSEAGATITIIFNIPPNTVINGTAYIMVVNGDKPVKYYPFTTGTIDTYEYTGIYAGDTGSIIDFNKSVIKMGGEEYPITFEAGSNFIKVQGAGKIEIEYRDDFTEDGITMTYQEGDYVLE